MNVVKKIVSISFWFLLVNLSFFMFAREAYYHVTYLVSIVLFSFFTCTDLLLRPISTKKDAFKYPFSVVLFLLVPLVLVLPFHETQALTSEYLPEHISPWISWIGITFLVTGGSLALMSRIQLGKYGSPKIVLEDEHKLVTHGIYGHIRNPIYLGFLFLFSGFSLSFQSFIFTFLIVVGLFVIFERRMDMEETLLRSLFGKEYESYVERTNRLIPHVY